MGGHDHHHHEVKIPDYKIYKVENCPELLDLQKALACKGLKDPWIRNEVWRFNPKEFLTHGERFRGFFFRGWKYGVGAFLVTIAAETVYNKMNPSEHHHGHHGGDHDD